MVNLFENAAGERMDFIKAHISAYNVQKEVSELLAMLELYSELVADTSDAHELIKLRTGYTVSQLSSYALEMSA